MRETMFDDSYNIREVLDDVIERVTLREKLISTAKQFAEKKREDRYTLAIKQFENLMGDGHWHVGGLERNRGFTGQGPAVGG